MAIEFLSGINIPNINNLEMKKIVIINNINELNTATSDFKNGDSVIYILNKK